MKITLPRGLAALCLLCVLPKLGALTVTVSGWSALLQYNDGLGTSVVQQPAQASLPSIVNVAETGSYGSIASSMSPGVLTSTLRANAFIDPFMHGGTWGQAYIQLSAQVTFVVSEVTTIALSASRDWGIFGDATLSFSAGVIPWVANTPGAHAFTAQQYYTLTPGSYSLYAVVQTSVSAAAGSFESSHSQLNFAVAEVVPETGSGLALLAATLVLCVILHGILRVPTFS